MTSCERNTPHAKKIIIIGMDGMDPRLCERMMDRGDLPTLDKLRKAGGFKPLGTSIPPQSPVAWSNFITGCDPGVHGIFDFIHRRPEKQCSDLYYSAADTIPSEDGWEVGEHRIPLTFWPFNHKATETKLLREGTPFWDYLDVAGVPMRIYDIPANYPPSESHNGHMCCLSGMGTPDLRGTQGKYQFFSEKVKKFDDDIGGGTHNPLVFDGDLAKVKLIGPENGFLKKPDKTTVEMGIHRDPEKAAALLDLQGQSIVLNEGEWSDWCHIDFTVGMPSFLPNGHAKGICRFFLQEVRPNFRLYVTPINIDPSDPYARISEPDDYIEDISDELGLFYTAGFQEDHKALSNRVFNDEQYRQQAAYVLHERKNLLRYATEHYNDGLLFFYFSSTDVQAHMFWWDSDEKHPVRTPENAKKYNGVIEDLYKEMDKVVGDMLSRYGSEATVMVMSDHGFSNFRRQVNMNAWLRDNGYLVVDDKTKDSSVVYHAKNPVDWNETRAYAVGLNGLYVNLYERERDGIVLPEERDALLDEITDKLLALRDPQDDKPVVARVYRAEEVYSGPNVSKAPDLIVGYHRGYRASWGNTLGGVSKWVFKDNDEEWSADHCIAAEEVPGVLFCNRPILRRNPTLIDLAPTLLEEFGVTVPESMKGGNVFKETAVAVADAKR